MSAEVLRRAAALMRERAEGATQGVWGVGNGTTVAVDVEQTSRGSFLSSATIADLDTLARDDYDDVEQVEADAEHIASWHPTVALGVADWLDKTADYWSWSGDATKAHALTVARTYLRESA